MEKAYLQQFCDDHIANRLWRSQNLSALEEVLRNDQKRERDLTQLTAAQDLGERVSEEQADSLFVSIRREIDQLLEVERVPPPSLRGTSFFSLENRETLQYLAGGCACLGISVGILFGGRPGARQQASAASSRGSVSRRRFLAALAVLFPAGLLTVRGILAESHRLNDAGYVSNVEQIEFPLGRTRVPTEFVLAHEYTHHVQKWKGFFSGHGLPLLVAIEGHARGVERLWARQRNRGGERPAGEYHQLALRLPELLRTYVALCDKLGKEPRQELLGSRTVPGLRGSRLDRRFLGYALFRISELSNGPIIYRDMLHGEFTLA